MCVHTHAVPISLMHAQHDYAARRESYLGLSPYHKMGQRAGRTSRVTTSRSSLTTDRPLTSSQEPVEVVQDVPAVAAGVVRDTALIELACVGTYPHRYHVCTLYLHRIHRWVVRVERQKGLLPPGNIPSEAQLPGLPG